MRYTKICAMRRNILLTIRGWGSGEGVGYDEERRNGELGREGLVVRLKDDQNAYQDGEN